jgi:hypothetical protein
MSCLSRDRLLEAVEAPFSPDTARHLASCPRCRDEVEALRRTYEAVRAVEVPEPSPLFWDHLTARVREAIAAEPLPGDARRASMWSLGARRWWRPACAATLILIVGFAIDRGMRRAPGPVRVESDSTPAKYEASTEFDLAGGADWQFIVDVAAGAADDVGGAPTADAALDAGPGAAELAVSELSPDERRELVKLLNEALESGALQPPRTGKGDV